MQALQGRQVSRLFWIAFAVGVAGVILAAIPPLGILALPGGILIVFLAFLPIEALDGFFGPEKLELWWIMPLTALMNGLVYGGVAVGSRKLWRWLRGAYRG